MFAITGQLLDTPGHTFTLTWDAGVVGGDPFAVRFAVSYALMLARSHVRVGPVEGPALTGGYLRDGIAAATLLSSLFEPGFTLSGDVPHRAELPPGEIH